MPRQKKKQFRTELKIEPQKCYDSILRCAIATTTHCDQDVLLGALRAKQYSKLLEWADRPSPQMYDSATDYYVDCQLSAFIRKYPFTSSEIPGIDPEGTAVKSFKAAEHRCKRQNQRARARRSNKRWDKYAEGKQHMRSYIFRVLGDCPSMEEIYAECDFTSGASMEVHGNKTNIIRKLHAENWTVTPQALQHVIPALWANAQIRDCILPGAIVCYDRKLFIERVLEKVQYVLHNKISFVPKTAKTHRSIAVEPLLNGFIQKGTDEFIRRQLLKAGVDLRDQSVNQLLAELGSHGGFNPYCTIDLAAASDSISCAVMQDLLPPAWFEFLSEIRAPRYMLPDKSIHQYQKFCSMGNGFCFPLQSLLYASVCYAAAQMCESDSRDFSVYGDDLVVRQNTALLVIEMLRDLGFRTNVDKTFITGPFRESCGSDWYDGQDVRPVHLDERLVDVRQLFSLHNSMLRSRRVELFTEPVREVIRSLGGSKYLRPGREPGDTCYSVPLDLAVSSPFVKWRRDSGTGRRPYGNPTEPHNQCWQWKEIKSQPIADPGRLGEVEHAKALVLAAMRGHPSQTPFTIRRETSAKEVVVARPWNGGFMNDKPSHLVMSSWASRRATAEVVRKAVNERNVHRPIHPFDRSRYR